ncbi:hypothetical protein OSB04_014353 [Centaurea solstitialis]|uniref:1,3-beta-glucan synthase n=1 Tax=Centaurea solstitialis TaxID=347529 RepID=A0AA38T4P4_9ASTR|nr:hypothetical protein OSB04_014353 [Centaurea solstitialis]
MAALRDVGSLRKPPALPRHYDLMDWLGAVFGFQHANVSNQREHIVLHLANKQMQLPQQPPNDTIDDFVLLRFRRKLLRNYTRWCAFLGRNPAVIRIFRLPQGRQRELLYVALYLLIWGESANLRFMPECICYIFHHMSMELNTILVEDGAVHVNTDQRLSPTYPEENAFLTRVVTPVYGIVKVGVENSKHGTAPYSNWRNYDDINELFWNRSCFSELKWPIDVRSSSFLTTSTRVKKTGFVEQRSFWNLFRSFDRLWIMLILFLQAEIIVAWEKEKISLQDNEGLHVRLLTVFITWSVLRFFKSLLDAGTQYKLVSKDTFWLGVRMVLKPVIRAVWIIVFGVYYARIWDQKNDEDHHRKVADFHIVAMVFIIPQLLALVLFLLPWVPSFLDHYKRFFTWVTWWFETECFVGHGPRQRLVDKIKYSVFWILVLFTKFSFSYLMQIKPMIQPTKDFLDTSRVTTYEWRRFYGSSNRFAVGLLWLPVILIYLMDLQIWYLIYSSIFGMAVGLFNHLGEIGNMRQLKLRFQYVANAIQLNLMPQQDQDQPLNASSMFGFDRPLEKLESNQVEDQKFASIWNEIILEFRHEDIVSNYEVELLEVPENTWNVRVVRWPCLLLCNELHLAICQAMDLVDASDDEQLWYKITKNNEYRRCAVIEAYDSLKPLLLAILNSNRDEHDIIKALFQKINDSINDEAFTKTFDMLMLANIHAKVIILLDLLIKPEKDVKEVTNSLQGIYEIVIHDFFIVKMNMSQLKAKGLAPRVPLPDDLLLFENAVELPDPGNDSFYRKVRRLQRILTSRDPLDSVPVNIEARRRIVFFSNSMFMNMPRSIQLKKMLTLCSKLNPTHVLIDFLKRTYELAGYYTLSVLTPYYDEQVVYAKEQLRARNEDGVSMLFYLQTLYADEWRNFLERMKCNETISEEELWGDMSGKLRDWASYRGQTLSRTVRGMMYYDRALKFLDLLDSGSKTEMSRALRRMKFTYVVACYSYGNQKARNHPGAKEILDLMTTHKALRVAYVDEVPGNYGKEYYSVLVKYDRSLKKEVEIYRVKLPGLLQHMDRNHDENQSYAIIFTRGDALQTIDAYQDNNFEEALKLKNLLQEFKSNSNGIRKKTILGVRESVFTSSVSSLARFMSGKETSILTLVQRVLANPLKMRLHYGHPDVFDRFWFLTRGGIGKASRDINSSHAVFAGFNCTIRGGNITHHEYVQVRKGRDFGFNQVSISEARAAVGSGEQVLSRDVYRLGHRLDFFRMLSFFYSTVGLFFSAMMVSMTVYAFLWGRLYMALGGVEGYVADTALANIGLGTILNQQFVVQLGLFTALPMLLEDILEFGVISAIGDFIRMQLQLSSVFFTFSLGTHAHYFGRTILHGGTKFVPPERGFVVQHKTFVDNYRHYARSHFLKAIELGLVLTVYAHYSPVAKGTFTYIALTISSWFVVFSWIMAPFVFNPSGFDWLKTVYDYEDFNKWIWFDWGIFVKPEQCWPLGRMVVYTTGSSEDGWAFGKVVGDHSKLAVFLLPVWDCISIGYRCQQEKHRRLLTFLGLHRVGCRSILDHSILVVLQVFTQMTFLDLLTSQLAFIPTGWGLLLNAQLLRPILENTMIWAAVVYVARMYEIMFGMIVLAPVAILSWMPGATLDQTDRLLRRGLLCEVAAVSEFHRYTLDILNRE